MRKRDFELIISNQLSGSQARVSMTYLCWCEIVDDLKCHLNNYWSLNIWDQTKN